MLNLLVSCKTEYPIHLDYYQDSVYTEAKEALLSLNDDINDSIKEWYEGVD